MRRLILLSLVALAAARYVDVEVREKRDTEQHEWLTEEQKSELKQLKESADAAALKKRTMELYELLPAAEKEKWNSKYKEQCVAWIKEIATEEENENYKKWKAEGKMDEIKGQYNKLKARLDEKKRKDVELWENECWDLWKSEFPAASRGRRSVMDLAEEKLSFLGAEKIAELKALKESGATDDVIRDKVVSWTLEHWKSKDSTASTADFVKKCYGWIKDVTQPEEYAAFEKLHHTDHEACRVKVREFLARLPADKQTAVEKSLPLCDAIWYKQHQEEHGAHGGHEGHDHHAHKHHAKRHLNTMHIEKFLGWLNQEQKDELNRLEKGDKLEKVNEKLIKYFNALPSEKKDDLREDLKNKCSDLLWSKMTETEQIEAVDFIQEGDKDGFVEYLKTPYGRLTEEEKHVVDHTKGFCLELWTTEPSRKRRDHHHHEDYKEYFTWLTPEQAAEVKALRDAGNADGAYAKTLEFYEALAGETKTMATEKLKGACKHFFKGEFGADVVESLKQMKESGSSVDDISKKLAEHIDKITDEKKKAAATRVSTNCKKVFAASRRRRDHHGDHHEEYKEYFSWLTPEQGAEVKALRDAGKQEEVYGKMEEYYAATTGEKKTEATEKLKGACKHFFNKAFGPEAVAEIKAMKESGSSMDDIGKKVEEFISKITDEKKKAVANRASVNCKKIFSASRRRRDHPDEFAAYKEYFTWLTPEQVAEVKKLKDGGDEEAANKKVHEFFAALTGDKKTEAAEKLKGACKHYFKDVFGEAAVAEIKAMKESGSSMDEIGQKVEGFISKITDEKKKAVATRASVNCKKVFSASRKRRDQAGDFSEYKEYFTWFTPEQAAEIKKLKEAGDQDGIDKKVHEYHSALSGDKRAEATEKLKGACKHFFKDSFGEAAVEEIKQMKESGVPMDDITKKVEELIGKITDEKKKAVAARASVNCKKLFTASRRRRSEHKHSMEEAFTEFLPWLNDAQKAELKTIKESGDEGKVGEKILEFYDSVDASKKDEARTKLQAGCRHFLSHLIGEAATGELKALKESGATVNDMATKLDEMIGKMPEGADKTKALGMSKNCKKVYGVVSRKRRHEHTLEENFTEFLPWITDDQKMEIKNMKESGASDKIGDKIMEYYDNVDASKKDDARVKLQAGCRHYLKHLLGDEVAAEMKAMHESGSTPVEMAKKLDEIISKMEDAEKKAKAIGISKNCKKVYGVVSRKRRHEHTLEEGFAEFLPWITEEQKMEIKNMKESGAGSKIHEKVLEYYEGVDASKKDEARTKLQAGCRHYLKHLLGDAVAGEMKAMHESGSSPAEMAKKLEEIIEKMEDGEKKTKAAALSKSCRKVYGVDARKRRELYGEYDERYHQYYNWLEEEQREELAELKDSGEDAALLEKVSQYFKEISDGKKEEARGQLKMGCRMRMRDILGEEKSEEIRKMKDGGATKGEMLDKTQQFVEEMEEGAEKESARRFYKHCAKILGRGRREQPTATLGDYTRWLSAEQRQTLNAIIRSETVSSDDIYSKLFEFLDELEGEKKAEATNQMRGACRLFRAQFLGPDQSNKLTIMRQTGKKWTDIEHTLDGMIAAIEDESKRRKAQAAMNACKVLYKQHIN